MGMGHENVEPVTSLMWTSLSYGIFIAVFIFCQWFSTWCRRLSTESSTKYW